jgi:L-2-hydroxyglutarate oxidase LhgO
MSDDKVKITIIGAGIIGLSVAYKLSQKYEDIILIEKNYSFGMETSSRNSEVIHAGIYYPENSLKAELCVKGRKQLYSFLEEHSIPYNKCGKYITAAEQKELDDLEKLKVQAEKNNVNDLKFVDKQNLKKKYPALNSSGAYFSPSTGIFDSHSFMKKIEYFSKNNNVMISYNSLVKNIEYNNDYKITVKESSGEDFEFLSEIVINCAGLYSDVINRKLGIDLNKNNYNLHFGKGEYFMLPPKYKSICDALIYPVIPLDADFLGIHSVIDMENNIKFGPNIHYVEQTEEGFDYKVDGTHKNEFYESIIRYFAEVNKEDNLILQVYDIIASGDIYLVLQVS